MSGRLGLLLALAAALGASPAVAAEPAAPPLRITSVLRCGDLLRSSPLEFCVRVLGLGEGSAEWTLGGARIPDAAVARDPLGPRLRLEPSRLASGPLAVAQAGRRSNAVWLSLRPSAVLAARRGEVAKNDEGITSYVDLVGVIVEEEYDAPAVCGRIATRFGAQVVGGIPPLRFCQLRLPAKNLVERDALVLRIGGFEEVDAVVVEESSPEEAERDAAPPRSPEPADAEWAANRFADAVDFYRSHVPGSAAARIRPGPIRLGVIERGVDFDSPGFGDASWPAAPGGTRLYAPDAPRPDGHGSILAGILAAGGAQPGFLRALDGHAGGFEVIVDRGSDAGIAANVAASVNLVEDGARVLNWSWGVHRIGVRRVDGGDVDTLVRSGIAVGGYEELFEAFFSWLREAHPDVLVVNSAGNGAADSGDDDYRLPSSFVTDQLLVVGGHERSGAEVPVGDPRYARSRPSSNLGARVDVVAAACARSSAGAAHCGTSYATALVSGLAAAMLSIDPALRPGELRTLLRRSALPIGEESDFEPTDAEDLTAPIVPSERGFDAGHPHVGFAARVDMREALRLAVDSLGRR